MAKQYTIDFSQIDFDNLDNKKQYAVVYMTHEAYGKLRMDAFYLPISSVRKILSSQTKGETKLIPLVAYREVFCNTIRSPGGNRIKSFTVEEVTHPVKLEEIAEMFLAYQDAPKE